MAGFKISIGLDDTQITKDAKEAAAETAEAFDDADIGGVITKNARSGFEQVGKDAKAMAAKAANELDALGKRGFFTRLHDQARSAFAGIASSAKSVFTSVGNIIQNALGVFGGNLLSSGISRLTDLFKDALGTGIKYNADVQRIGVSLKVLSGSAEIAAAQLKKFKEVGKVTPFEFTDLAQAAVTLQSYGFTAQQVTDDILAFADAASKVGAAGGGFQQGLQTVSVVMGQIRSSVRVSLEDIKQLTTKGIAVFDIVARATGKTTEQVLKDFDKVGFKGQTLAKILLDAFKNPAEGIKGFSEEAGKTFEGRMSTVSDIIKEKLGAATADAFKALQGTLDKTITLLEGPAGDKLVSVLAPKLAAPVELLNKALDAIVAGNFEQFGVDAAKEFLKGLGDTIEKGIGLIYSQLLKPALEKLSTALEASFKEALNGIELAIIALGVKIQNLLKNFKAPTKEEVDPIFKSPAPGVKSPFQEMMEFFLKHPGMIGAAGGSAAITPQNVVFQRPKPPGQRFPQIPGNQQLPNIIETPGTLPETIDEETQRNIAAAKAWAQTIEKLKALYRSSRIDVLSDNIPLSTVTLPGVEALTDRTVALKENTAAQALNAEVTKAGTVVTQKSSQTQAQLYADLLNSGEAAKQLFDFGLRQTFEGMFSSVITGAVKLRDAVSSAIFQIRSRVGDFLAQGVGNLLFGGGGTGSDGGTGGGGGGFFGNLFGGLFRGGSGAAGAAGGGAGQAAASTAGGGFWSSIKQALGFGGSSLASGLSGPTLQAAGSSGVFAGVAGGASSAGPALAGAAGGGLFGAGGFLGGLAAAGPLIGFSAGTALGGKSLAGQLVGGAGGAIAGAGLGLLGFSALGGTLATTGFAGAATALLTNPFTIAFGAALLVGAYFLGKSKQRKQDEQQADAIWVNEREQTRAIIAAVNSDRMDGSEAIQAHAQLRAQTIAQLNQIKTKSVRDSRLNNQLRDLDNTIVRELQDAIARQAKRRGIIPQLSPEFAQGGFVPGIDRGVDSVLIKARPGEVILNQSQQARLSNIAGAGIFQRLGVPQAQSSSSFQGGGFISSNGGGPDISISLTIEGDGEQIGKLVAKGLKTSTGSRATVRVMDSARRNGEF